MHYLFWRNLSILRHTYFLPILGGNWLGLKECVAYKTFQTKPDFPCFVPRFHSITLSLVLYKYSLITEDFHIFIMHSLNTERLMTRRPILTQKSISFFTLHIHLNYNLKHTFSEERNKKSWFINLQFINVKFWTYIFLSQVPY